MAINEINQIVQITQNNLTLFADFKAMELPDGDSIGLMIAPSTDSNYRFDGGLSNVLSLQVLVKNKSWAVAYNTIKSIYDFWQFKKLDIDKLSNIECRSNPTFVEKTEHKEYIFTAIFDFYFERG